jgi:predicted metal-dependent hydrolase
VTEGPADQYDAPMKTGFAEPPGSFRRHLDRTRGVAADRFPSGFAAGVRHFNASRFFEAHEAFENLLEQVEGDDRWELLLALIQVAVGYHKCTSGHPGAERMLRLGLEKLAPFPALTAGVDVDALRTRVAEDLATLGRGGSLADQLRQSPPRLRMRRQGER